MCRFVFVAVSLAIGTCLCGYPKPSTVPISWELQYKYQGIKRIRISLPGEPTKTYWYMIYTITNETDREVVFHPEFALVTNKLQVLRAAVNVPPEAFKAIKRKYQKTYPWLEHPRQLVGKIARGEDNARSSVAIWPDFDPTASRFSVYVGGLSGETADVPNPLYVAGRSDPKKVPAKFVLRKTLRIKYSLPTDPSRRRKVQAGPGERPVIEWVMR